MPTRTRCTRCTTCRERRSEQAQLLNNGVPSQQELQGIFDDCTAAVLYLLAQGVLNIPVCPSCDSQCSPRGPDAPYIYRCRACSYSTSILRGSIFEHCRVGLNLLLFLLWNWCIRSTVHTARTSTGLAHSTVSKWYSNFRLLVACVVRYSNLAIGGPGKVVQIDESKFGKRKKCRNRRGHRVDGVWVFGGVEVGGNPHYLNNKYFAVCVEERTAATLLPLIRR